MKHQSQTIHTFPHRSTGLPLTGGRFNKVQGMQLIDTPQQWKCKPAIQNTESAVWLKRNLICLYICARWLYEGRSCKEPTSYFCVNIKISRQKNSHSLIEIEPK